MKELVETEEKYVEDLRMVCDGYLAHMRDPECSIPMPEDLRSGKDKIVFGNIEAIYEWHRELVLPLLFHSFNVFGAVVSIVISEIDSKVMLFSIISEIFFHALNFSIQNYNEYENFYTE